MWSYLVVALVLGQDRTVPPVPLVPVPTPRSEAAPAPPSTSDLVAEAKAWRDRRALRLLGAGGAALAASGAAVLIVALTSANNPALDSTFGNAALGALMTAGVGFFTHSMLGGRGEVLLGLLLSAAMYASSAAIAKAVEPRSPESAYLTTAFAALPASVLVALALELSSAAPRDVSATVAPMPVPGGGAGLMFGLHW